MEFPKLLMVGLMSLSTIAVNAPPSMAQLSDGKLIAQSDTVPQKPLVEGIDFYTDHFFYAVNPELNRRKLRSSDRGYIREWHVIRRAITPLIKNSREVCGRADPNTGFWEVDLTLDNGGSTYDYLADVIFYHRNPQYDGQKLRPGTNAAQAWSAIREKMFVHACGS